MQDGIQGLHLFLPFAQLSSNSTHGKIPRQVEVQFQVQAQQWHLTMYLRSSVILHAGNKKETGLHMDGTDSKFK